MNWFIGPKKIGIKMSRPAKSVEVTRIERVTPANLTSSLVHLRKVNYHPPTMNVSRIIVISFEFCRIVIVVNVKFSASYSKARCMLVSVRRPFRLSQWIYT